MKTRMQPVGRLFQKYPRVVRDLSRQLGKQVELEISGEETELDKTMIEDLNDPLMHLVRNAVDHGIETPEERAAQGKPAHSVLRLSAEQIGDHIMIQIRDDGRGMRPDVLRRKAVEKGLIEAEAAANMDDQEALKLVFLPGFSTKDNISSVSGRGVGMDVVKTNIQKLNGRIEIKSVIGEGSIFTIYLPLTLAILPVLVIKVGEQPFAVPLSLVREIIPIKPDEVQEVAGRATMMIRNEVLPIRSLAGMIGWPMDATARLWRADAVGGALVRSGGRRLRGPRRRGHQTVGGHQAQGHRRRHVVGRWLRRPRSGYGATARRAGSGNARRSVQTRRLTLRFSLERQPWLKSSILARAPIVNRRLRRSWATICGSSKPPRTAARTPRIAALLGERRPGQLLRQPRESFRAARRRPVSTTSSRHACRRTGSIAEVDPQASSGDAAGGARQEVERQRASACACSGRTPRPFPGGIGSGVLLQLRRR